MVLQNSGDRRSMFRILPGYHGQVVDLKSVIGGEILQGEFVILDKVI